MKISQEEIDAAHRINNERGLPMDNEDMREILEAAYTVRKQRKALQARTPAQGKGNAELMGSIQRGAGLTMNGVFYPSKAPEWDGTFHLGPWEMRNGEKAYLTRFEKRGGLICRMDDGFVSMWARNGLYTPGKPSQFDLIRPWPKGEQ